MPVQFDSENYSVEVLLTEIGVMNALLTALDGKPKHSFATPCGQTVVGGQDYIAPLQASIARRLAEAAWSPATHSNGAG